MNRVHQSLLIGSFVPFCWFGMMAVHEVGHVTAALASGGTVERVVVYPLTISRTDVSINPRPLLVAWAGPFVGVVLPLALLALVRLCRFQWAYLAQFFAGFCLIANGSYIGAGAFQRIGDAGDLLRHGSPVWLLWLFGLVAVPFHLDSIYGTALVQGSGWAQRRVRSIIVPPTDRPSCFCLR